MVKFKLRGEKHNTWPLKVVKTTAEGKEYKAKIHLKGGTEHNSEGIGASWEDIKKQLGNTIIWDEESIHQ